MALALGPRIYSKNFKWGVLPKNKIDTVTAQPVINTPLDDADAITQEVSTVTVGGTSSALPIALNIAPTHQFFTNNHESGQPTIMCNNFVGCVVATGSVSFTLEKPLPKMPTAKLHVSGTTHYINRGSLTHSDVENNILPTSGVATWVHSHASGEEDWEDKSIDSENRGIYEDPHLVDYTGSSVPLFGWVRVLRPAGAFTLGSNSASRNQPDPQDVLTTWVDQEKSDYWAKRENWSGFGMADAVEMWPVDLYAKGDMNTTKIVLNNKTVPISTTVVKIDDYNYRVDYSIPVRYEYMASSQYYTSILGIRTYHDLDNYCFLDRITKLTVELQTQQLDEDSRDISVSLDGTGALTDTVLNVHPLSFERNELITLGTLWGNKLWIEEMPRYILEKFQSGKYVVECEVPATWALRNNVHVNTEMTIQLQDTTKITRNGADCVFLVKNITKHMQDNNFMFTLSLMEV
jgi:hypothetical protein